MSSGLTLSTTDTPRSRSSSCGARQAGLGATRRAWQQQGGREARRRQRPMWCAGKHDEGNVPCAVQGSMTQATSHA
eukprot:7585-Chlamydomonas_euryale.AAC.1